jgi:hypothetical protein
MISDLTGQLRKWDERNGTSFSLLEKREVLQLCSHPVIGWTDASPGLFGLRSVQVAPI